MKKIIILLIAVFLLTGCYDNIELNKLAIIPGIGIDYQDDEFILTYEILNDIKTTDNMTMKSYTAEGKGKTIAEAFTNTNYKVGKKAYFAHLKVIILSESIIQNKLDEITDYLLRDTNIRDEFIVLVANKTTPSLILKHNNVNNPVVSDYIVNLTENEKYNNNFANTESFQKLIGKLIGNKYDITLSSISLAKDELTLNDFYIFDGYNVVNTLSTKDSSLYMLLSKGILALDFTKNYPKGNVTISVNRSKTGIDVTANKIKLDLELEGKIVENNADFNLKSEKSYQTLDNDFNKIIEQDITKFIKLLQQNKSDILGFQDIYYKSTKKNNYDLWENASIEVNVNLKINTKGFIFEVGK